MQEDNRKRQEICRAVFSEAGQLLGVVYQYRTNPTKLETPAYAKFEVEFWLLPQELAKSIRRVHAEIDEANGLLDNNDTYASMRRNDLWYNYLPNSLRNLQDDLQKYENLITASEGYEDTPKDSAVLLKMSEQMKWDLFICHASEDKQEVAEPLAKMLQHENLKVWYDKFTLLVGDSLRRRIDEGLVHSRYGIVILSPSFFMKNWPQKELDGLTARQDSEGRKVILPVWHDVDRDYVVRYSPTLADVYAARTNDGLEAVVRQLLEAISEPQQRTASLTNRLSESKMGSSRDIVFLADKLALYERIKEDLVRIRIELIGIKHPLDILFPSWNETDFDRRDALVEDDREVIETFSNALNSRNRRMKELLKEGWDFFLRPADDDALFLRRNKECIEAYEQTRKKVPLLSNLPEIALSTRIRIESAQLSEAELPNRIEIRGRSVVREAAFFYFMNVRNHFDKDMNHVTGDFVIGGKRKLFHFLLCPLKQEYSVVHPFGILPQAPYDWEGREEFAIALLNAEKWHKPEVTLKRNDFGITCALLFALDGADYFIIPSNSRQRVSIPGRYRIDLLLKGEDMPYHKAASLLVDARAWNQIDVRRILDDAGNT